MSIRFVDVLNEAAGKKGKKPKIFHFIVGEEGQDWTLDVNGIPNKAKVEREVKANIKEAGIRAYYDDLSIFKSKDDAIKTIAGKISDFNVVPDYDAFDDEELDWLESNYGEDWEDKFHFTFTLKGKDVWGMSEIKKYVEKFYSDY